MATSQLPVPVILDGRWVLAWVIVPSNRGTFVILLQDGISLCWPDHCNQVGLISLGDVYRKSLTCLFKACMEVNNYLRHDICSHCSFHFFFSGSSLVRSSLVLFHPSKRSMAYKTFSMMHDYCHCNSYLPDHPSQVASVMLFDTVHEVLIAHARMHISFFKPPWRIDIQLHITQYIHILSQTGEKLLN